MEKHEAAPEDKFRIIYFIFGWLGIVTLLPWNFFITVSAYWDDKWKTISNDTSEDAMAAPNVGRNEIQTAWNSNMAMASNIPNVIFLLLNAYFGHHFKTTPRLLISLIFVILMFGVTCAMAKVDTDQFQNAFWTMTIVSIVLININSAIFQGEFMSFLEII